MTAAKPKGQVGIVGLGIMGGAIAKNLSAAGWQVIGHDIDANRCAEAKHAGVEIAEDAVAVAEKAEFVLVSLPKPEALMGTVDAIAAAKLPRRIFAELSTFSLDDKAEAETRLRAAGHTMLDCPLSGTGSQARTKDLVVYASGDAQAINRLMPVFADFSRLAHDLGAFGNGMKMKFVANLLVAIHNVASAEAMVLGMKAGLDPAQIFKLIQIGRRQLARVRAARADDGRGPLRRRQSHHAHLDLAEGHEGDRRVRGECRLPDAAVLGERADLSRGALDRLRRSGHRRGVRRAGGDGGCEAVRFLLHLSPLAGRGRHDEAQRRRGG